MKILGIDPGLQVCGYAVVEAKLLDTKLIEAGVFRTDGKAGLAERLCQIADDIGQVVQHAKAQASENDQRTDHAVGLPVPVVADEAVAEEAKTGVAEGAD